MNKRKGIKVAAIRVGIDEVTLEAIEEALASARLKAAEFGGDRAWVEYDNPNLEFWTSRPWTKADDEAEQDSHRKHLEYRLRIARQEVLDVQGELSTLVTTTASTSDQP